MKTKMLFFFMAVAIIQGVFACAATTKKGTQCRRAPSPGSIYCWQHGGKAKKTMSCTNSERQKTVYGAGEKGGEKGSTTNGVRKVIKRTQTVYEK